MPSHGISPRRTGCVPARGRPACSRNSAMCCARSAAHATAAARRSIRPRSISRWRTACGWSAHCGSHNSCGGRRSGRQRGSHSGTERSVTTLLQLSVAVRNTLGEWWGLPWRGLQLSEARTATLILVVLIALCVLLLLARGVRSGRRRRGQVALPALLPVVRRSPFSASRHGAFLLFAAGI